ncbi:MAG TPA: helix-turn-helix domain-containing protein, partial [Candidatus Dormibacteraeota bacterium]|nr:helix-turn-helix domain-containing protein [Candidatus Dormibacteraeota bacterium]
MSTARDRPPEEAPEDTAFARGLRVLLAVADRGEVRADDLAAALSMPVSTVYRYLRTLAAFGFVDRREGRFGLGPRLLIGGGAVVTSERLIRAADPVLRSLADRSGETALVMRRIGLSAVCLHEVPSEQALRVGVGAGSMHSLQVGAFARVLLAFAPGEVVDEVLAAPSPSGEPLDEAAVRSDLDRVRETGW